MIEQKPDLILASVSPRRRELLQWLGLPFMTEAADVDERPVPGETPSMTVRRLAEAKAVTIAARRPNTLVIAADTAVVVDGQFLGKPESLEAAVEMLRILRGRRHDVLTGLALARAGGAQLVSVVVESAVWMRNYTDADITRYVTRGEPFDKAGGYAIQDPQFSPVAMVIGCYTSVMGLPVCHLWQLLSDWGATPVDTPVQICQQRTGYHCLIYEEILRRL